ncbi:Rha family transcriptional regulator [Rhizobium sp. KVB221]|uniref:Rha family transcriptional regulator n=1 Tax=Rhizobium setariae TaxID=2801340 RepID=A0A936YQZ4_9HYPH|nr:Rha family transcriptional regulator [Rhizobium setariae]
MKKAPSELAAYFGKEHFNVLQDIDALIKEAPEAELNFQVCSYQAVEGGRSYRMFDMTRDGFALLTMGFNGKKALQFKLKCIDQYDAMEATLKALPVSASTPAIPITFAEALRLAADEAGSDWLRL